MRLGRLFWGFPTWRQGMVAVCVGVVCTVGAAWGCATWSPEYPPPPGYGNPLSEIDPSAPAAISELYDEKSGLGWSYTSHTGTLSWDAGKPFVIWDRPYNHTFQQSAGWPFKALESHVGPFVRYSEEDL